MELRQDEKIVGLRIIMRNNKSGLIVARMEIRNFFLLIYFKNIKACANGAWGSIHTRHCQHLSHTPLVSFAQIPKPLSLSLLSHMHKAQSFSLLSSVDVMRERSYPHHLGERAKALKGWRMNSFTSPSLPLY